MKILRTPDQRFANLPDFPFKPNYREIKDADAAAIRIHYLDEGPATADPVLLMHGEPSWCYLYRKVIPPLAAKGHRAVAPDLVGFGRSDKPAAKSDYTYERHVRWMSNWLAALDLKRITLFCQDWGGLIGLRLVAALPDRFARVVVANTGLPVGVGFSPAFQQWLDFSQNVPELPVGNIVNTASLGRLTPAEQAAYDAPFPDESYKEGARVFPTLVPITPQHGSVAENQQAWRILESFQKPFLTAFSDSDPITKGGDLPFQQRVPGAKGQHHVTIKDAGHMLQENQPLEVALVIDEFIRATSR
ncbi:MAG TPA: haloalkane dehalogenase [Candidatus Binatus sp.]|nr:haloalkane dehalogenase [Candidatus Binatus sp.]